MYLISKQYKIISMKKKKLMKMKKIKKKLFHMYLVLYLKEKDSNKKNIQIWH